MSESPATYWARRAHLNDQSRALVLHRQAIELETDSADAFFATLETKLDAIERYSEPHPASAKLAAIDFEWRGRRDSNPRPLP